MEVMVGDGGKPDIAKPEPLNPKPLGAWGGSEPVSRGNIDGGFGGKSSVKA